MFAVLVTRGFNTLQCILGYSWCTVAPSRGNYVLYRPTSAARSADVRLGEAARVVREQLLRHGRVEAAALHSELRREAVQAAHEDRHGDLLRSTMKTLMTHY